MEQEEIKELLEFKYQQFNAPEFIETDPIQIPHLFTQKEDIEISGFITATLAWGKRNSIIKNSRQIIECMDYAPYDFIMHHTEKDLNKFQGIKHRTFNNEDLLFFITSLRHLYQTNTDMETVFTHGLNKGESIKDAIIYFREVFLNGKEECRTQKHVANPSKGSAAKRINMFLRWMIRKDNFGVDFGIWDISPSELFIPLDVHVGNVSRKLELLNRKSNDWKAVEELTTNLSEFDPKDPVKYDYALFGLGVFEKF